MGKPLAVLPWRSTKEHNRNRTRYFFLKILYSICLQEENAETVTAFPVNSSRALIASAFKDHDYHHSPKALFRSTLRSIINTYDSPHPLPDSHVRKK